MMLPADFYECIERLTPYFAQIVDAQLKDYGESANSGVWVSFRLPEPESLEIYRGQDRSGRNARSGRRYKLFVIEVDDDEVPVNHQQRTAMETKEVKPRKLSQISGAVCHEEAFRQWVAIEYGETLANPEEAAQFIRDMCGIASRSELDSNDVAATTFRGMLADYETHKQAVSASTAPPA